MEDLAIEGTWMELAAAGLILAAAIILSLVVGRIFNWIFTRFSRHTKSTLDDVIFEAAMFPLRAAILAIGLELALKQISLIPDEWDETLSEPGGM